uniref:Immunoglobulin V-set domain-containing protein n=1 Tax=Gouania willdenowi TaxID=441366 RepID=A0A8C5GP43_GOUWI
WRRFNVLLLLLICTLHFQKQDSDKVTHSLNEHSDLYWYKQEVNSYPKFILRRSRYSADNSPEFVKDRFDAELKDSSVPLMIQDLHVCDSAVYYCNGVMWDVLGAPIKSLAAAFCTI